MNLNWSNRVIKYVLFIFNLLFVISGIILIAVGVSVKTYYTDYDIFLDNRYFSLPNLLIAIGSLIFFISFFGCCGAIKESWFMIFIFSILLTLIFIMEFSAGIAGYVLRDQTRDYLSSQLASSMSDYEPNNSDPNPPTVMWDEIQSSFQCCGVNKPDDWIGKLNTVTTSNEVKTSAETTATPSSTSAETASTPSSTSAETTTPTKETTPTSTTSTTTNDTTSGNGSQFARKVLQPSALSADESKDYLPASCCKSKPGTTGIMTCMNGSTTATVYEKGCIDGFGDYLKDHAVTLGGVGLAIAFIQLFGIIFACHLTKQLKHGFYST